MPQLIAHAAAQIQAEAACTHIAAARAAGVALFEDARQIIGRNAAGRETVKTESTSVMVAFDFDRQESVTVPERWRRNLAD